VSRTLTKPYPASLIKCVHAANPVTRKPVNGVEVRGELEFDADENRGVTATLQTHLAMLFFCSIFRQQSLTVAQSTLKLGNAIRQGRKILTVRTSIGETRDTSGCHSARIRRSSWLRRTTDYATVLLPLPGISNDLEVAFPKICRFFRRRRSRRETKDRTQCDEKCEQGSGHRRREFGEQYNSFPLSSLQIFGGTVGNQLPRQAQGLSVQFSMFNLGTRPNSRVLFVTSVTPRLRAWAAMNRSFAPIIVPRVFKWARIFA
jgi:hypothetical protein